MFTGCGGSAGEQADNRHSAVSTDAPGWMLFTIGTPGFTWGIVAAVTLYVKRGDRQAGRVVNAASATDCLAVFGSRSIGKAGRNSSAANAGSRRVDRLGDCADYPDSVVREITRPVTGSDTYWWQQHLFARPRIQRQKLIDGRRISVGGHGEGDHDNENERSSERQDAGKRAGASSQWVSLAVVGGHSWSTLIHSHEQPQLGSLAGRLY